MKSLKSWNYLLRKKKDSRLFIEVKNNMNLQENILRIKEVMGISESTIPITIKRRASELTLKEYITKGELQYPTLCDDFEDEYEYADAVIDYGLDEFLYEVNDDIFDEDYYSDVMDYLRNTCRDLFGEYLIDVYKTTCSEYMSNSEMRQEQNESEITERCWKGYTQKGMKTMFGKRYPNCVKKKK
jgi:hypothetical protein